MIERARFVTRFGLALYAVVSLVFAVPCAQADAIADFYAKKNIRLLIGFSTGGGYDLYARVLARHMSKHIPGNPTILPENMPGAGGVRVANYLYAVAPKDGTIIGTFNRGLTMEGLLNHTPGIIYDATKFTWLGSVTNEATVCGFSKESGIKTWQDMQTKSFIVGGTGTGSDNDIYPTVLKHIFGLNLKLITGFPGSADVDLAMARHEVDGRCGWSWTSMMSRDKANYEAHDINVPVQLALTKHPDLPDVPLVIDLTDDPKKLAVLKLIGSRQTMARPFAMPPNIPADRAKALRDAFDATMKDPDFLAEAKRLDLEVRPVSGLELTDLITQMAATPKEILDLASAALQDPK